MGEESIEKTEEQIIPWAMVLMMLLNLLPVGISHAEGAGDDKVDVLTNIVAEITQN